jgi:hypothetical protein
MKFYSNHAQEPIEQGCKEEKHEKVVPLRDNEKNYELSYVRSMVLALPNCAINMLRFCLVELWLLKK